MLIYQNKEVITIKSKIHWALPSSTVVNTVAVICFSAMFGGLFFLIDVGISALI